MIKSMTGFGQGEVANDHYAVRVEVKSVNHRYLDLFLRIPKQYTQLEEVLRRAIGERITRGRVEAVVSVEEFGDQERSVQINAPLLRGYLEALKVMKDELGSKEAITLDHVLPLPGVLEVDEPPLDWEDLQRVLLEATNRALDGLEEMRASEGRRLFEDLQGKIDLVENLKDQVAQIAPQVVVDYKNRLRERLDELLNGTTLTEERFLGEVAIFADRCSIDEELVRLTSHIQQLRETLHSDQSVGRKLDFLIQEMNREVNTIGSKGNNVRIAGLVVELKSELEKIREQMQNIE
ncbi:MAG: YicC family protein [Firmicutes bacterium]|nr:YicC family protein [Bacillota bacterium]